MAACRRRVRGFAVVTERGKRILRGIERADSVVLDAHKWFFQPYEWAASWSGTSRRSRAVAIRPDFLQDALWGSGHPNFWDRGLQMSRSARALKIWMSVQTFGMAAFRRAISNGMDLAARAQEYIDESPVLACTSPASLSVVCFRVDPAGRDVADDDAGRNQSHRACPHVLGGPGVHVLGHARGLFSLRLCIVNHTPPGTMCGRRWRPPSASGGTRSPARVPLAG